MGEFLEMVEEIILADTVIGQVVVLVGCQIVQAEIILLIIIILLDHTERMEDVNH